MVVLCLYVCTLCKVSSVLGAEIKLFFFRVARVVAPKKEALAAAEAELAVAMEVGSDGRIASCMLSCLSSLVLVNASRLVKMRTRAVDPKD